MNPKIRGSLSHSLSWKKSFDILLCFATQALIDDLLWNVLNEKDEVLTGSDLTFGTRSELSTLTELSMFLAGSFSTDMTSRMNLFRYAQFVTGYIAHWAEPLLWP